MATSRGNATLYAATGLGTVLQFAMVIGGHFSPTIANLFAVIGVTISAVVGWWYARRAQPATKGAGAAGGAIAGGVGAFIGVLASYLMGDVQPEIFAIGTGSSAVTGALGGLIGQVLGARTPSRA